DPPNAVPGIPIRPPLMPPPYPPPTPELICAWLTDTSPRAHTITNPPIHLCCIPFLTCSSTLTWQNLQIEIADSGIPLHNRESSLRYLTQLHRQTSTYFAVVTLLVYFCGEDN